jgi:Mg2+/Co2+ transporter CorB
LTEDQPLGFLFGVLGLLLILSAFFSGTETALMSLNRYRLRHRARSGHRGARLAEALLRRPDRLIGLILLGNNLVNISAASLVTLISLRLGGEAAIAIGTGLLTLVILIFAEVAPKTLAALHPERVALPAAYIYYPLLRVLYPFVWLTNLLANAVLRLFGVRHDDVQSHSLSSEELRTVVNEAGAMISRRYRRMLTSILDLEKVTVDDIMVPHNEIIAINLEEPMVQILDQIQASQHTRLPAYRDSLDNVVGILHIRRLVTALRKADLTRDDLVEALQEPYYVPEGTPLSTQLVQFQQRKRRLALVVDEYGDIQGMVTLEDILQEIVGEFRTVPSDQHPDLQPDGAGGWIIDGSANVRELNRLLGWQLPTDGPKTLNGLILETLETIPEPGTLLELNDYPVEILATSENMVRSARIREREPPRLAAGAD